jgi:hypothetical protein
MFTATYSPVRPLAIAWLHVTASARSQILFIELTLGLDILATSLTPTGWHCAACEESAAQVEDTRRVVTLLPLHILHGIYAAQWQCIQTQTL